MLVIKEVHIISAMKARVLCRDLVCHVPCIVVM